MEKSHDSSDVFISPRTINGLPAKQESLYLSELASAFGLANATAAFNPMSSAKSAHPAKFLQWAKLWKQSPFDLTNSSPLISPTSPIQNMPLALTTVQSSTNLAKVPLSNLNGLSPRKYTKSAFSPVSSSQKSPNSNEMDQSSPTKYLQHSSSPIKLMNELELQIRMQQLLYSPSFHQQQSLLLHEISNQFHRGNVRSQPTSPRILLGNGYQSSDERTNELLDLSLKTTPVKPASSPHSATAFSSPNVGSGKKRPVLEVHEQFGTIELLNHEMSPSKLGKKEVNKQ